MRRGPLNYFDVNLLQWATLTHWNERVAFDPGSEPLRARARVGDQLYLHLIPGIFVGLHDELLTPIRRNLAWMEEYEPPLGNEPSPYKLSSSQKTAVMWWWTMGLGRWIACGEDGVREFRRAADHVHAQWQDDQHCPIAMAVLIAIAARRYQLVEWICQQCLSETGRLVVWDADRPMVEFARWMARHLEAGGTRDARVVARFEAALRAWYEVPAASVCWTSIAQWLKEIYWESGLTKTPLETLLRLYEVLPQIEKPDFSKRPETG